MSIEFSTTEYPKSPHFKDRTGQTIKGIEILQFLGQDKHSNSVYRCRCHCGNVWDVRINAIIGRENPSCGCSTSRLDNSVDKWKKHIGEKHGRLTIIDFERVLSGSRYRPQYICRCDCGNTVSVRVNQVLNEKTLSCGCYTKEIQRARLTGTGYSDGLYKTRIFNIWEAMHHRCYNKKHKNYMSYGGRGIGICYEWHRDNEYGFKNFYRWAMANGYQDNLSIERDDVDDDYYADNCRWVTQFEQSINKRNTVYVSIEQNFDAIGKPPIRYTFPIPIWAKITGMSTKAIRLRLANLGKTFNSVSEVLYTAPMESAREEKRTRMLHIPPEYMKYNRPDKFDESIHD